MNEIQTLPIDQLAISGLRNKSPLPWPNPVEITDAQRLGITDVVVVRKHADSHPTRPRYEILKGLPIWLLAQKAMFADVPVIILDEITDDLAATMVNDTDQANPIAVAEQIDDYCRAEKTSVAAAARHFGFSRAHASHLRRLLTLTPTVQKMVRARILSFRHAKMLIGLPAPRQLEVAKRIARDGLSTRQCEALLGKRAQNRPVEVPAPAAAKDADTLRLEESIGEHLGTRVSIDYLPTGSGTLAIDFHDLDTLDGVLQRLGCDDI